MPTRPLTRDQMWLFPPSLDEMIPEDHVVRFVAANVPMMWLLGRQHPDHSTLARFLQKNRQAMKGLFKRTVCTAVEVGLVDFAFQAIDGTRVGNVSRDKALRREELLALNEKLERVLVEMGEEIEREEEEGAGDAQRMPEALPPAQARPETSGFHKDAFVYQAESDSYLCPAGQSLRLESRTHLKTKGGRIGSEIVERGRF